MSIFVIAMLGLVYVVMELVILYFNDVIRV